MNILSFQNFRRARPEPVDEGWSQFDLAEFYRAHKLLNDQGILVGLDQGMTDEHEPWLVFYDHETHDVFLHIARIDGNCILLCEHLSINLREKQIGDLIQRFEYAVRSLLDNRAKQNSNVITHPAARIITTVAAVFLLFKMENNRAHAESFFGNRSSNNIDNSHPVIAESRLLNIHRASLSRIFETIDTPLHAAMMASIVVSNAIAFQLTSESLSNDDVYIDSPSNQLQPSLDFLEFGVDFLVFTMHYEDIPAYKQLTIDGRLDFSTSNTTMDGLLLDREYVYSNYFYDYVVIFEIEPMFTELRDDEDLRSIVEPGEIFEISNENKFNNSIEFTLSEIRTIKNLDVLNYLYRYDFDDSYVLHILVKMDQGVDVYSRKQELEWESNVKIDADVDLVGEISIREIKTVSTLVEEYFETQLHYTDLGEMLRILMSHFDNFEIQIFEGNILVEQGDIGENPYSEVALWTNIMADGSEISFIGSLSIIDDITFYMT